MERERKLIQQLNEQPAEEREREIREWAEKRIADKDRVVQQLRAQIGACGFSCSDNATFSLCRKKSTIFFPVCILMYADFVTPYFFLVFIRCDVRWGRQEKHPCT
jgi:hypothetical protein